MNKLPPINWINMILFTATPVCAITLVPAYGYVYGYGLYEWLVFLFLMTFCGLSITGGYHRLWSHKTYSAHPALRFVFSLGGACSIQNDILHWASDHRRHHQYVDNNERDPYSAGRGFWFSHIGWILRDYDSGATDFSNVKDLMQDPIVMFQHRHYLKLVLLTNIALPAFLGYLNGNIIACLLLGGLLRLVLSQHATYLINSLAHIWGRQPYSDDSSARDNSLLALVTYGEGYHNYHHTFQWDYRNGVKWWHFDPTKWMIRSCSLIGLTKNLKRCTTAQIEKAKLEKQYRLAKEHCELLNIPEKWRTRLSQEYEQFLDTLQLWSEHHQAWYATKGRKIQKTIDQWDHRQLHDKYKEIQYALKAQKRRWQKMLRNLGETTAYPT
tara:strand:+ start:362 stop:1510 length:1149 start_codon:yes stop_codon:yes gene_type:complete